MITRSPVLPGQQDPALFLPHGAQPILSHLAESPSSPLDEHKFQVWMEWQEDTTIIKCSVPQKCIWVGLLLPEQKSPHSTTFLMFSRFHYGWMCQCYSSLDLIKAWWLVLLSKQLSSKSVTVYSKKVNSTRGQRNVHPKFTNDKILHFIISIIFSINKNDIVYLKAMKHYLFYF